MLVDRDGHQFTRHTVSFHAPEQADAGLLARQSAIEVLVASCRDLQQKVDAAQDAHGSLQIEAAERSEALEHARLAIAERHKAQHDAQIDQLKLAQAQERYRERSEQVRAELAELGEEASRGEQALQNGRQAAERIAAEIAALRDKVEAARGGHLAAETALADQRRAVQQAERDAQDALFGERECSSKIAEIDNSVRVIDQQLERADLEVAKLTEELSSDPIPAVRQRLGAVNLAALEELRSSQERKGFLDSQSADLEEAVRTLEDAIRRIDRETRELLRETFDSVNRHFGSLFPTLFGGGDAKLIMTGEEILDAGIQVMAQPPGKRNTSIHLLSGGEKALTAIALVFSLFQLNPAPFCILDEVDAPLDDSNTVRF